MKKKNSVWATIAHFAAHTFVGTALFLIIGTAAVGLSMLVKWLEVIGVDGFTTRVLGLLEHAILISDAVLFITHMGVGLYKFIKELVK